MRAAGAEGPAAAEPDGRPVLLVLRALGLGDFLTVVPALRALSGAFPGHRRVLACPSVLAPLALHSGVVDEVRPTEPLGPVHCLRPDVAVNLHGRGPESHRRLLETGPGRLVAFRSPEVSESAGLPCWRPDEHEVERWCRLLAESGIPADPARLELPRRGLPAIRGARGATVVHPGAAYAARRWPAQRWAAVCRSELALGRRVIVTAGPGESALAQRVAKLSGLGADAVREGMGILELAGLIAQAGRVACGDTGVAHLATALGRPSVVLFGPTPPALWGPPPAGRHTVLWKGRRSDPLADRPAPGLLAIQPPEVASALAALSG
ncbi:MAG: glycosyltransferase family 9 protein [Candidatus Dormibacteraeota bacterium]|nr:glycosyltransferase family 9 protein [Candidatus Dormibacteraeota bacterium]